MSVSVECPNCRRKLRIEDDLVGKKVRCPDCKTVFVGNPAGGDEGVVTATEDTGGQPETNSAAGSVAAKTDDGDEQEGESAEGQETKKEPTKEELRAAWNWVRLGVTLVMSAMAVGAGAIGVYTLGVLLMLILAIVSPTTAMGTGIEVLAWLTLVATNLLFFAAFLLICGGEGCCFLVPNDETGMRKILMYVTLGVWVITVLGGCGGCGCISTSNAEHSANYTMVFGGILPYAHYWTGVGSSVVFGILSYFATHFALMLWVVAFWYFMRNLVQGMREPRLAKTCLTLMIAYPAYNVIGPILLWLIQLIVGAIVESIARDSTDMKTAINLGRMMGVMTMLLFLVHSGLNIALLSWQAVTLNKIRQLLLRNPPKAARAKGVRLDEEE